MTPEERSRRATIASYSSWGYTVDRSARTAPARKGFDERFLAQADGDPLRAEALRKAYFLRLSQKGVAARKRRGAMVKKDAARP